MSRPLRLQKVLAGAGIASRRRAEDLIRAGRVAVNGRVVTVMGVTVDPDRDAVTVDGRPVRQARPEWVALNKPAGHVVTRSDPQGRPTVYDLLPADLRGLFHVGRLDAPSEGLLLFTNDGDAAHRLLHPRYRVRREYRVLVAGSLADAAQRALLEGVMLEDGPARAASVRRLSGGPAGRTQLRLVLEEGRKREVRRMLRAVGYPVLRLRRTAYGPIRLGRLPAGQWRRLTGAECAALRAIGRTGGGG
jgi:23S rRNA pseudouridine2605 synthase